VRLTGENEPAVRALLESCALEDPDVPRGDALWVEIDAAWPEAMCCPAEPLPLAPREQAEARRALAARLPEVAARAGVALPAGAFTLAGDARAYVRDAAGEISLAPRCAAHGRRGCAACAAPALSAA
jgi:hypothetical protein